MIKKSIKPLNFITLKYTFEYDERDWFNPTFISPGVNINLPGEQERLVLDADGDMRITGRLYAIGNVIWNQELHRLEFWDGNMWQHLITNNIV